MNGSAHGTDDFEPRREQKDLFCTRDEAYGRKNFRFGRSFGEDSGVYLT